uniref:Proteoglycan 4-like n=1 Tax=Panagrellus redivivus TaxID=6233 RepID=A0A7E4VZU8_PANRE
MDNMDCYDHYEAIMADFGCTTTSSFIKALSEEDPLDDEDWVPPPKEWVNKLYGFFRLPPPVYEVKPKKKTAKTEPSTSAATDPTTTSTTTTSPIAPTTTSTTAPTSTPGPSTTNPTAPLPTKAKKRKVKVDENGQVIKRPRKKVPKKAFVDFANSIHRQRSRRESPSGPASTRRATEACLAETFAG